MDPITFRERDVPAGDVTLRVLEGPRNGPSLFLVHGIYGRADTWLPVMPALADRYHVIAQDLRGHHRSSKPQGVYTLKDYARDAANLMHALGIEEADVIGHSLGARITMVLAADFPDRVGRIVLEDPPSGGGSDARPWLQTLLDAKHGTPEETYARIRTMNPNRDDAEWRRMTGWLRDTADEVFLSLQQDEYFPLNRFFEVLGQIEAPALILQADPQAGGVLSDEHAQHAMQALPNGTLLRFPGVGHSIHKERPDDTVAVVTAFLSESSK